MAGRSDQVTLFCVPVGLAGRPGLIPRPGQWAGAFTLVDAGTASADPPQICPRLAREPQAPVEIPGGSQEKIVLFFN